MKKTFLIVALAMCSITTFAQQTDRSKVLAGGIFNMNFSDSKSTTNFSSGASNSSLRISKSDLTLTPNIGIFLFKNFAMGLKLRTELTQLKDSIKSSNANFNVGPFVRYYFNLKKFAPLVELGYGIGNIKTTSAGITTNNFKGSVLTVGGGLAFFLTERIGIEGILNYERISAKTDVNAGGITTKFSAGNAFRFNIGLQAYL
ncbi:MAG: hypothetical protein RJA07_2360 [Bacteroidota bacterium]|jgi:opacity protein-like surface antigen